MVSLFFLLYPRQSHPCFSRLALVHGSVVADCEGLPRWLLFFPKVDVLRALGTCRILFTVSLPFITSFFQFSYFDDYIHMPTFMQRSRTNSPPFLSL